MIRSWEMAFVVMPVDIVKEPDTSPPELLTTMLLPEILTDIFATFHFRELLNFATVSQTFNLLVKDPLLLKRVIYRDMTFNPQDWKTHFGNEVLKFDDDDIAYKSLPITIGAVFKSQFLETEEKKFGETHVIVWKPAGLSLNKYLRLLKENNNFHVPLKISYIDNIADQLSEKSEWLVMTRKILKDSPTKDFSKHAKIVEKLPKSIFQVCAIPTVLEAFIAISTTFIKFETKIFDGGNVARCIEPPSKIYEPDDQWHGVPLSVDFDAYPHVGIPAQIHIGLALYNCKLGLSPIWKFS